MAREALVADLSEWASEDLAMMQQVATGVRGIGGAWDDLPGSPPETPTIVDCDGRGAARSI